MSEFFCTVRNYFQAVLDYLLDKLPFQDPILKSAVVVDPKEKLEARSSQLEIFMIKFPALIPEGSSLDAVLEQFSAYQITNTEDCYQEGDHVDRFWTEVARKHPTLQDLAEVMKGVLTIPHSSAACERIFSMVRKTCTEGRSSMLQDTTEALLVLKTKPDSFLDEDREFSDTDLASRKSAYYKTLKK